MTLWNVTTDLAFMGIFLIIGQILRTRIKLFQFLLMPASLIGGFIGLILGPSYFNIIPFSNQLSGYAGILIAIIFACMPIGDNQKISRKDLKNIGGFFYQNTGILILQYAFGMSITIWVLKKIWPSLNDGFGLILATGFYGGHGTAAAVGEIYKDYGYLDFFDLGNASATVGIVAGILFGMALINWGTRKGYTNYVKSPKELPEEIRTGLIPKQNQKNGGKITISNMSLDPLAFHLSIILIATILGKYLTTFIKTYIKWLSIPVFVSALIVAYLIKYIFKKFKLAEYVDRFTVQRISGTATDLLVVSAIASLKLNVIANNFWPLLITFILAIFLNIIWFLYVSRYTSTKDWFERGIMNYGRSNGVVATGVLLNRVVDPDQLSRGLEDTGITDLINRPIAIALQVLPPLFISMGSKYTLLTTIVIWVSFIILTFIALWFRWWIPYKSNK